MGSDVKSLMPKALNDQIQKQNNTGKPIDNMLVGFDMAREALYANIVSAQVDLCKIPMGIRIVNIPNGCSISALLLPRTVRTVVIGEGSRVLQIRIQANKSKDYYNDGQNHCVEIICPNPGNYAHINSIEYESYESKFNVLRLSHVEVKQVTSVSHDDGHFDVCLVGGNIIHDINYLNKEDCNLSYAHPNGETAMVFAVESEGGNAMLNIYQQMNEVQRIDIGRTSNFKAVVIENIKAGGKLSLVDNCGSLVLRLVNDLTVEKANVKKWSMTNCQCCIIKQTDGVMSVLGNVIGCSVNAEMYTC